MSEEGPTGRVLVLEARFEEFLRRYEDNRNADKTALGIAKEEAAEQYNRLNHLRQEVLADRNLYATEITTELRFKVVEARISALERFLWMGLGALVIIGTLLRFWQAKP